MVNLIVGCVITFILGATSAYIYINYFRTNTKSVKSKIGGSHG